MNVTIGTIMNPIGTQKSLDMEKRFFIQLSNIRHRIESQYLLGYKHIRIPHIIPNCDYKTFVKIFEEYPKKYEGFKNILSCDLYSVSNHAMYQYFNYNTGKDLKEILDYYRKIFYLVEFLGIKRYYHVTHLTESSAIENIKIVKDIIDYETCGKFSKCVYIENCDKGKAMDEVLEICSKLKLKPLYDNLHDKINKSLKEFSNKDLCPNNDISILHYSNSFNYSRKHNNILELEDFLQLIKSYEDICKNLLLMVELNGQSSLIPKLKINTRNIYNWDENFYSFSTYN